MAHHHPTRRFTATGGVSRRQVVGMVSAAAVLGLVGSDADALEDAATTASARDDHAELQRLIDAGNCTIRRRPAGYTVSAPLIVPAGRTVSIEGGTRLLFTGRAQSGADRIGVFVANGNGVRIVATGSGEALVVSQTPSAQVYAVVGRSVSDLEVSGLRAHGCHHVFLTADAAGYGAVSTAASGGNACRRIRIRGGGASFDGVPPGGDGACYIAYAVDWEVTGSRYENVAHGIEWWGGDASPGSDGATGKERKCADFRITDVTVHHCTQAGIWGSMGHNGTISRCRVVDAGDVAFDAEGSTDITFRDCYAEDGKNGCYASFFFSRDILFANCTGVVNNRLFPLFRTYNVTQDFTQTGRVTVSGGRFECRDKAGVSTMDTHSGPVRHLVIRDATLVNVRIDTTTNNMHVSEIINNSLTFPYSLNGWPAIKGGSSRQFQTEGRVEPGSVVIERNRINIRSQPTKPGSKPEPLPTAIEIAEDDYNSDAVGFVRGNTIVGRIATAVAVRNNSGNFGRQPRFTIANNKLGPAGSKARPLETFVANKGAREPYVEWTGNSLADGTPVPRPDASPPR
jgi:hypothetical protein